MTNSIKLTLVFLFSTQLWAHSFLTDSNAYQDVQDYLGITAAKTFRGVDQKGQPCELKVQKSADLLLISTPSIPAYPFKIPKAGPFDFSGYVDGAELSA